MLRRQQKPSVEGTFSFVEREPFYGAPSEPIRFLVRSAEVGGWSERMGQRIVIGDIEGEIVKTFQRGHGILRLPGGSTLEIGARFAIFDVDDETREP